MRDLAKAVRMPVKRVEEIEAGIETWLSETERQIMAKALRVEPWVLQEVEYRSPKEPHPGTASLTGDESKELANSILHGVEVIPCPRCKTPLNCSVQEGLDIEGRRMRFPKAFCPNCPFVLK